MHEALVLRDGLDRELATYQSLLELGTELQTALIARDTRAINALVTRQETLMSQAAHLEEAGREALTRLAGRLGMEPEGATVSQAAERLEPTDREAAEALRSRQIQIARCAEGLAHTNWVNAQLLESAMDAIRFTFQLLADGASEPEASYPAMEGPRRAAPLLLDQHA